MRASFDFILTPEEFSRAVMRRGLHYPLPRWVRPAATLFNIALFGAFGFLGAMAYGQRTVPGKAVLLGAIVGAVAALLAMWISHRATGTSLRASTYMAGTRRTLTLEEGGVRITSAHEDSFHPWSAFSAVEPHGDVVHLLLDPLNFHPIPFSAFESDGEREEFVQHVAARIGKPAAPTAVPPVVSTTVEEPTHVPGRRAVARRMLLDAIRLAFFLDVPPERLARGWAWVLLAAALTLLVPALPGLWRIGLGGEWNWYLLPFATFHIPLVMAASIVLAYVLARRDDVRRFALAGFLAAAVIDMITTLGGALLPGPMSEQRLIAQHGWVPGAWLAGAMAAYACRSVAKGARRLGAVLACLALVAFPLAQVHRDRALWHAPYSPDDDAQLGSRMGIAGEDAFYKQPALLAQELDAVRPGVKGVVDVFFVGVAGYGLQDVFMKEVNAVARIVRERFGADGHVIRLVNNPKTLLELPIASRTSLRAALKRMAEVMDRDEDVLVLFLTSHGSDKHKLSLNLWPMSFHDLDPAALRAALDETGIRNRVVIVSACYSGGFVKPLEDPNTLVITAAAAGRTSFGYSDEAEWTYFGRAYFDEALRKTHSFAGAFELARPAVAAREKSGKFEPSNPQMSIGAAIAPRLELLAAQREGRAGAAATNGPAAAAQPDRYREYVNLMFADDYLSEMRAVCEQTMVLSSPETSVKADPRLFQGLEKSPRHWGRVKAAWARYVETSCRRMNEPALVAELYLQKAREVMSEPEVTSAIAMLSTPQGARWLARDREAVRRQMLELGRAQAEISNELYKKYVDELGATFAEFQKKAD